MNAEAHARHADFCEWHHDQYDFECTCDALTAEQKVRPTWLTRGPAPVKKRLVIVESPYAGDIETNVAYARAALNDCLMRGEAPIASHLLYTQEGVLSDDITEERELGIEAGLAWGRVADAAVFYLDMGWSPGMLAALDRCQSEGRALETRTLPGWHS